MSIYNRIATTGGTVVYKDFDSSFKSNPATGDLRTKTDNDSIKQSVKNILLTAYGERPFEPLFGSDLGNMLFELYDEITKNEMKSTIKIALRNYEPRVEILSIDIDDSGVDRNEISMEMTYRTLNNQTPQKLYMLLTRTR